MSFSLFFQTPPYTTSLTISSSSFNPKNPLPKFFHTKQPKPTKKLETLAARDVVIDFGKHKGKMLGTLPSNYLKWVSKNLRARDFEHWAELADEVLKDPVYQDRIEWEFAEKILQGTNENMKSVAYLSNKDENNVVSMLLEIGQRFGWDNEDKVGWNQVNFELLGTSKGSRIPRLMQVKDDVKDNVRNEMRQKLEKKEKIINGEIGAPESGGRRKERRERVRLRKEVETEKGKTAINGRNKGVLGNLEGKNQVDDGKELNVEVNNPFPGRESLLKKVLSQRRFL